MPGQIPLLAALEEAAMAVIDILKEIESIKDARIAVIGGMALWTYIPHGRTTKDVDFIINIDSAPESVKKQLLALPNSPFSQDAQKFNYNKRGAKVQIDITPVWQSPYMPSTALAIKDVPKGFIPYISSTDLIVFKIYSCGLRAEIAKRHQGAMDAQDMLHKEANGKPLRLASAQKSIVEQGLPDVLTFAEEPESWWRQRLGFQ
ncbi:hypothetical protein M011DRAFT_480770 [Sporormia fimetaria CBS 119925]|uniref:Uncharacterized protein n=1 Tax=Sporormia fimetaria CBS 119925 TaxID=1340428 RepID=A0A6A6UYS4_9PLEO|nr:hypothetical protein M011DRAFT_480770 [Sporormia fimetaria CBS 119925]